MNNADYYHGTVEHKPDLTGYTYMGKRSGYINAKEGSIKCEYKGKPAYRVHVVNGSNGKYSKYGAHDLYVKET